MSLFTTVVSKIPRRNRFHQPHERILSANFGAITPVGIYELDPGDTFVDRIEASIKVAPMKAPAFGRIDATFHFFFVPRRLLYDEFEDFITGGTTGNFLPSNFSELNPVAPYFDFNELGANGKLLNGSLSDYLGMPTVTPSAQNFEGIPPIDAMPYAGYSKIFSDWYRDELLDTEEFEPLSTGKILSSNPLFDSLTALRYRAWKKDYFTSARPDTQLGPEVGVPVTGEIAASGTFRFLANNSSQFAGSRDVVLNGTAGEQVQTDPNRFAYPTHGVSSDGTMNNGNLLSYYDGLSLDNAEILINNLRRSLKVQEWREKNMRGGNRYIENMFHHFGVKSSDARLQRSQYLGGRKLPVVIGEVLQSVDTRVTQEGVTTGNPLGQRGGIANAGGVTQKIKFFAEEHGFVYCLLTIMPKAAYFQGIPRLFADRWDPMSYVWPEFGNLGEQEVYNWELFLKAGSGGKNDGVFGYQSRYSDRKFQFNTIHGEFRSDQLMSWHTGRQFSSQPQLNKNFIYFPSDDTAGGMNRLFVVERNSDAAHFYVHVWHDLTLVKTLPKYGIPSI